MKKTISNIGVIAHKYQDRLNIHTTLDKHYLDLLPALYTSNPQTLQSGMPLSFLSALSPFLISRLFIIYFSLSTRISPSTLHVFMITQIKHVLPTALVWRAFQCKLRYTSHLICSLPLLYSLFSPSSPNCYFSLQSLMIGF